MFQEFITFGSPAVQTDCMEMQEHETSQCTQALAEA